MQILKLPLAVVDVDQKFDYGEPFELLHVGMQHGEPVIWFLGDPGELHPDHMVSRTFGVFPTGADVPNGYKYVGTAQDAEQSVFVWHVFEREA